MNFRDWYTDIMDVRRNEQVTYGNLKRKELQLIEAKIPCRVYSDAGSTPNAKQTAADLTQSMKLACDNSVEIAAGDELTITIGGGLGKSAEVIRARAGSPHHYYEPFGAIAPQLAHQEVNLLEVERL